MSANPQPATTLVTGGARGIGRALVERFLRGGHQVIIADKLPPPDALAGREGISYHQVDLADPEQVRALAQEISQAHGAVDVLVNNAATGFQSISLLDMPPEHWDLVQATNLRAVALLSKALLGDMIQAGRGVIINVASCSAFTPEAGHTAYAASKAGLIALTRSLAREVGRYGIRVVCIVPGWIGTEGNRPTQEDQRWLAENVSLGRVGRPEEVAEVAWFLASEGAAYITGQAVIVDGGMI